jgi:hypothetical protein
MQDLRRRIERMETASGAGGNQQRLVLVVVDAGNEPDPSEVEARVQGALQKTSSPCVVVDLGRPSAPLVLPVA